MRDSITVFRSTPLVLAGGQSLSPIHVEVETWGRPDPDHAILICHALTGDAHALSHSPEDRPGWWEAVAGPGRPIDPDRAYIIATNVLGGAAGTTGPASLAPDGLPYGLRFPLVTVEDMVHVQRAVLAELGVHRIQMVTGGSLGGMQALAWTVLYPALVDRAAVIGTTPALSDLGIGLNAAQREAILDALAAGDPRSGLKVARMIAMLSYRSGEHFDERFGRQLQSGQTLLGDGYAPRFQVESYLRYQGTKLAGRFNAWSYLTLSRAMDLFDYWRLVAAAPVSIPATRPALYLAGIRSDWLFPPQEIRRFQERLAATGVAAHYTELDSALGHDAFLIDAPGLREWMDRAVRGAEAPLPATLPKMH